MTERQAKRDAVANELAKLLADSYTLYLKTHNFHWNVTGPMFNSLHLMFEQQYTELAIAVDDIAERIRALGHRAPGSYKEFSALSSIEEAAGVMKAEAMVRDLLADQHKVVDAAERVHQLAADAGDEATGDMMIQRIQLHEKNAWMLQATLDD